MTTNLLLAELLDTDGNIRLNGTQTIKKRTTTSLSCWQQEDGTERLHWYWNTEGGILPKFYRGNEHALDLSMHGDPSVEPYLKFRTSNGIGKITDDDITWTDTLLVDPTNFVYTLKSNNQFIVSDTNIKYNGYNLFHQGNVTSMPFLPLTGGTLSGNFAVITTGNTSFEIGRLDGVASAPYMDFHSGATAIDFDSRIIATGGNGTNGQGDLTLTGYILNDGRTPTKPNELISKWWIDGNLLTINQHLTTLDNTTISLQNQIDNLENDITTINQHLTNIDNIISQLQNDVTNINNNVTYSNTILALSLVDMLPDQTWGETGKYSMIKSYGGAVKSWGQGTNGQLGNGEGSDQNTPRQVNYMWNISPPNDVAQILISGHTSYIRTASGIVYGTGNNANGQLGLGASDVTNRTMFTQIPIPAPVNHIATSGVHSDWTDRCSTFFATSSAVYAVGYSASYQTGANTTTDLRVPTLVFNTRPIQKIIPVMRCTYLLATDGSVWAAGENNDGQLAQGNTTDQHTFSQCLRAAGTPLLNIVKMDAHCRRYDDTITIYRNNLVYAIDNAGKLYGAGYNGSSMYLGTGNTTDNIYFTQVSSLNSKIIVDVCIGGSVCSTIAVTNTGEIYTWGYNGKGQLGLGDTTTRTTPTLVNSWNGPGPVPWLGKVKKIYATKNSSNANLYILTTDGMLLAAGENNYGEMGPWDNKVEVASGDYPLFTNIVTIKLLPGEYIDDFVVLGVGNNIHLLAKTNNKRLLATGINDKSQTGVSTNNTSVFGLSEVRLH